MLKVTYKVPSVFSIKKFKDSPLLARSYEYPMLTTIRGAILSSMIERKGRIYAKDMFRKIKNAQIFIQYTEKCMINQFKIKRMSNKGYEFKQGEDSIRDWPKRYTVGIREYVLTDKIVFYIDETIPDIVELLANIDRIGDSESIVMLQSVEKVQKMENVLVEYNIEMDDVELYELYDWSTNINKKKEDKGVSFDDVYIYSNTNALSSSKMYTKKLCYVKDCIEISQVTM